MALLVFYGKFGTILIKIENLFYISVQVWKGHTFSPTALLMLFLPEIILLTHCRSQILPH
jgi:hypothetical protein